MKINKQTKRKCMRNAFRDIKIPRHVPSQSAVLNVLGEQRSTQGWQNSLRTYRRCRCP